jgi:hypothetical protein
MSVNQKTHVSWVSVVAYVFFGAYIVGIGVGATFHWRALDLAYVFVTLAAVAVMSSAVLWRAWKQRGEPGGTRLGQLAALPRGWRNWMLGEHDERA